MKTWHQNEKLVDLYNRIFEAIENLRLSNEISFQQQNLITSKIQDCFSAFGKNDNCYKTIVNLPTMNELIKKREKKW